MPTHLALIRTSRHRGRPHGRIRRRLLAALVSLLCAAGIGIGAAGAFAADTSTLVAAPAGSGTSCSVGDPCAVGTAVAISTPGTSIVLQTGNYGDQTLRGRGGTATQPVIVTAADGATPTFGRLDTYLPYATWHGVTATTTLYIRPTAVGTVIDAVHLDGAGMFVRSTDVTVQNSVFENGHSIDGIQIGRASRVKIVGNTISHYDQSGTSGLHADCVQIFDATDIVIRGNWISNCYNSGIIFSGGAQLGLARVTVEANFIQGCVVKSDTCKGGAALDLREKSATDITVRNNTILDGSTRLAALPGIVFDRNIVSYFANCDAPITDSIITAWNVAVCGRPAVVDQSGNRAGTVSFIDREHGDLHLADVQSATVQPVTGAPVAADIDGLPMPEGIAGAASGGTPTAASTPAPVSTSVATDTPTPVATDTPTPVATGTPTPVSTDTPTATAVPSKRPAARSPALSSDSPSGDVLPGLSDTDEPSGTSAVRPLRFFADVPDVSPRTLEILARADASRVWIQCDGESAVAERISAGRWAVTVPEACLTAVSEGDYDLVVRAENGDVTMISGFAPDEG